MVFTVVVVVAALDTELRVVLAALAQTGILAERLILRVAVDLARLADASGVAGCAPIVVACRAPVWVALGATVIVTTRAVDLVGVLTLVAAVVAAAVAVRGDVVTWVHVAVLLVDGALVVSDRGKPATGVVNLFPGAVSELLLEGEASDDETTLDFLLVERVGEHDVARRVCPAQFVSVGALPLHGRVDFGVDETSGGRGDNTVTLSDGAVHGLFLYVARDGHMDGHGEQ